MLPFKPTRKAPRSGYPELAYIKITHTLCGRKPTHFTEEKPKWLFVFPEKSKQKELIRQQNNVPNAVSILRTLELDSSRRLDLGKEPAQVHKD